MQQDVFSTISGDRPGAPNIGVILTDGESNRDQDKTVSSAQEARSAGIYLLFVGIGDQLKQEEVRGIPSKPVSQYTFLTNNFDELESDQDMFKNMLDKILVISGKYSFIAS